MSGNGWWVLLAMAGLVLLGCKSGGGDACELGHEQLEGRCVPIFDDCPAIDEIPVLGGGCQKVGVQHCGAGFISDGVGGCEPVLPSQACPAGSMGVLGSVTCQPVGVSTCAAGFASDGAGGCEPTLPAQPCPDGTIEQIGSTQCEPLGDCGTGTWGTILGDGNTVYVDQSYAGGGSNGSPTAPFLTIDEGLTATPDGGQVAVAAGHYVEVVQLSRPVRLVGRCAEMVTIAGTAIFGQDFPALTISGGALGSTVRGFTLTGPAEGIAIDQATGLLVEEVQVLDVGDIGLLVEDGAFVTFQRVAVRRATVFGLGGREASAELVDSVIASTLPNASGDFGRGVNAFCGAGAGGGCGAITIRSSLIVDNFEVGVLATGPDVAIESSVVRDTRSSADGTGGNGVRASCNSDGSSCGRLDIAASVIEANRRIGIYLSGAEASIRDTVVRDTLGEESTGQAGIGISLWCDPGPICADALIVNSRLTNNRNSGLYVAGPALQLVGNIVEDTQFDDDPGEETGAGWGVGTGCDSTGSVCDPVEIRDSLVQNNRFTGVNIGGTDFVLANSVVRDTMVDRLGNAGEGVSGQCHLGVCPSLELRGTVVAANRTTGVVSDGSSLLIDNSLVRDTAEPDDLFIGLGVASVCNVGVAPCRPAVVRASVIENNFAAGIILTDTSGELDGTVVQDSHARGFGGIAGYGVGTVCIDPGCVGMELTVNDSTIRRNEVVGITASDYALRISGLLLSHVEPNAAGLTAGSFGEGIAASCFALPWGCATVEISDSHVSTGRTAGILIKGRDGFIEATAITSIDVQAYDEAYGVGIQVEGLAAEVPPVVHVSGCYVEDASLAGLLYVRSGGTLGSTLVQGGEFSVALGSGSTVNIRSNNRLAGVADDEPVIADFAPAPSPAPLLPSELGI